MKPTVENLIASLCELTPLLAFSHTLIHARGVCLKNCGSISEDIAVALAARGFDARVVAYQNHFVCGVNVEGHGIEIDLSHLQFDDIVRKIHADVDFDNPELEVERIFKPRIWRNPYLIGRVKVLDAKWGTPRINDRAAFDAVDKKLRATERWIAKDYPDYASGPDAAKMLDPLCALV